MSRFNEEVKNENLEEVTEIAEVPKTKKIMNMAKNLLKPKTIVKVVIGVGSLVGAFYIGTKVGSNMVNNSKTELNEVVEDVANQL